MAQPPAPTQRKMRLMEVTPDVFLAEPIQPEDEEAPPHPPSEPELVILCSWMGAGHAHIQKYTDAYRTIFPAASILLIRSNAKSFLQTTRQQLNALRPAHALLAARYHAVTPGPSSPILVHTFSNGGSINLQHLEMLFDEAVKKAGTKVGETAPLLGATAGANGATSLLSLPARSFIFDSCPGRADVGKTVAAFTAPLKSAWVKVPASLLVGAAYFIAKFFYSITRSSSPIDSMRNYLSTSVAPVPRLYIYGPGDALIAATDVEAHAEEAKKQGIDVRLERFDGSMHVAHMRADPDRYWGAVKDIWLGRTA